ncbi:MAG: polysaccharide biosynthesis/export family protein [Acidobacteriota bacterium]|nr:polysaccharide biosynthesis/export family protein [Acidobacteriota bacterium]
MTKLIRISAAVLLVFLCAATLAWGQAEPAKPAAAPSTPAAATADGDTYVIGESDLLTINVWHEPDLSRDLAVRTDGKITLPLIGELQASGQTVEQLRRTIAVQLKKYMEAPEVTVIVKEARSQFFTIVGMVQKPGSYPLTQRLTVMEGLAMGGGFKDFAKKKKILVVRTKRDGTTERLPFNYEAAANGELKQNFALEQKDMIVVP